MSTLTDLVPDPGALERIATGSTWAEGPLWVPATGTLRWSDIPGDRILQWHASSGADRRVRDRRGVHERAHDRP